MPASIKFSSNQYKSFMAILSTLKNSCTDLTIEKGKIHQLSETKTLLYDIDLTKYFQTNTVYMNNIDKQFSMLNMYALDNHEVNLVFNKNKYSWVDKKSVIEYLIPDPSNLNPKHLDPEQTRSKDIKAMGNKIFETTFDRTLLRRISQASKILESKVVALSINNDVAKFIMIPGDLVASTKFEIHKVDELNDESYICSTEYDINSFLLPTEEIKLSLYKNSAKESAFIMLFEAVIEEIPIKIWSATRYVSMS